jgi:hypothetical protein
MAWDNTYKRWGFEKAGFIEEGWKVVDRYDWDGVDLDANPHEVTVEGDTYDYRVLILLYDASNTENRIQLTLNDDETTNYRNRRVVGFNTTMTAFAADAGDTYIQLAEYDKGSANNVAFSDCVIYGLSGNERIVDLTKADSQFVASPSLTDGVWAWKNTADELTKLTFKNNSGGATSGVIIILRRPKTDTTENGIWELIEEKDINVQDINTTPIDFTGLSGDSDVAYRLEAELTSPAIMQARVYYNDDFTVSNYITSEYYTSNPGVLGVGVVAHSPWAFIYTDTERCFTELEFIPKSNEGGRPIYAKTYSVNAAGFTVVGCGWWNNTADEVTKISIASATVGTTCSGKVRLYKRRQIFPGSKNKELANYDVSGDFTLGNKFTGFEQNALYEIVNTGISATGYNPMDGYINNDKVTAYIEQSMANNGGASQAQKITVGRLFSGGPSLTYSGWVQLLLLNINVGRYPVIICRTGILGAFNYLLGSWWMNDTDDITSLQIQSEYNYSNSGNIRIYKSKL